MKENFETRMYFVGDFNTRLGALTQDTTPNGKYFSHPQASVLLDFINRNGLQITNVVHDQLLKTYVGALEQHHGSVVDFLLTKHNIENFEIISGLNCDHRMLSFEIKTEITAQILIPPIRYKMNNLDSKNTKLWKFYLFHLNEVMEDIYKWARKYLSSCDKSTKNVIIKIVCSTFYFCWNIIISLGIGFRSPRYWHSSEFNPRVALLEKQLKKAIAEGSPNVKMIHKKLQVCRKKWNYTKWNTVITKIEKEGLYSKTFNKIFRSKSDNGGISDVKFKKHFDKIFGKDFKLSQKALKKVTPKPSQYDEENIKIADDFVKKYSGSQYDLGGDRCFYDPPTLVEIEKAVKKGFKTKPDGAPGRDRITWRMVSESIKCISPALYDFYRICWEFEVIPIQWARDILITLRKNENEDHSDPGNYRPIFLQSIPLKILDRIIDTRLQDWLDDNKKLETEQGGFVRRRGTIEQNLTVREICSIMRHEKRNLYAAFLDCKAAFDRVGRSILFKELFECGVQGKMWDVLKAMYENTTAIIGDETLNVECGIREGGMSSPTCFNIHFRALAQKLRDSGCGIHIENNFTVSFLFFADDIVIFSESMEGLQKMLDIIWKHAQQHHFSFGIKKCQYIKQEWLDVYSPFQLKFGDMILNEANCPKDLSKGRNNSKNCERMEVPTYKYLGITETLDANNYDYFMKKKEIDFVRRLQKVKCVGGTMNGLRPQWSRQLYTSQLRPILEYGATVIPWTKKYISHLEKLQLRALKVLFGFRRSTKNETVRILTGLPSMRCRIAQLKISAFKKLELFDTEYYLRKLVHYECQRKHSFWNDVNKILNSFSTVESENREIAELVAQGCDGRYQFETFKYKLRENLEALDLKMTKLELEKSCNSGTKQPTNVIKLVSKVNVYDLCPILKYARVQRFALSKYIQTIAGCDFLTPHNYTKKPTCRFCRCSAANWKHLLFECDNYQSGIWNSFNIDELHTKTAERIQSSIDESKLNDVLDVLLLLDSSVHYLRDLQIICAAMSKVIVKVERDWASREVGK